jgi:hypothetical protein
MNAPHFHLLLNHIPVIGITFGVILFIISYLFRTLSLERAGLVLFILAAAMAVPSYFTGEGAEDAVENIAGLDSSMIEQHESWAGTYIWFDVVLGVLSCFVFWLSWRKWPYIQYAYVSLLFIAISCVGISLPVANSGGEIRHTEIRQNSGAVINQPANIEDDD